MPRSPPQDTTTNNNKHRNNIFKTKKTDNSIQKIKYQLRQTTPPSPKNKMTNNKRNNFSKLKLVTEKKTG